MRKAAIFLLVVVNSTWVFIAFLLHRVGVALLPLAVVVTIGVILGNAAAYGGMRIAARILAKR